MMKNKKVVYGLLLVVILVIAGLWVWSQQKPEIICGVTDSLYCRSDSDCICADAETEYPGCFLGNKNYYEKCIDKTFSCEDYCVGWGQPPVKCINNQCTYSYTPAEVTARTNEIGYEQGETVEITVRNDLGKPIYYFVDFCDPHCCGIERLEGNDWKPVEKIFCIMLVPPLELFDRTTHPTKLEPGKEIAQEWQPMKRAEYDGVTFIEPGRYRVLFSYGMSDASYNEEVIHSNEFTINEEEYPTYGKIINVNLNIFQDDTVTEAEPIEITIGSPTSKSVLEQTQGNYLLRVGEKVDRLRIGTVLWSQSFQIDFNSLVLERIDNSELVSFRIPYKPEMKSLQLWRKDKDKLIFFKELPKFYPIKGVVTGYKNVLIEKADVELWKEGDFIENTYTNEKGEYSFAELEPAEYEIVVRPRASANAMIGNKKGIILKANEIINVNFALDPGGSVSGKITDAQGNPLAYGNVYEIGFEKSQYAICEEIRAEEGECELGTFIIPYLEAGEYRIGAEVKIGEEYIELPSKEVKIELNKTVVVNFVVES